MKALILFLFLGIPALADLAACDEAYRHSAYDVTLKECSPLADRGNARAQFIIGTMYNDGHGVPQDYRAAARWFRLAADQGYDFAQDYLGQMYAEGRGVPQDYREAVRLYRLAADREETGAQNNLGMMYANGQGVPQDYIQAHMWFNLAGANGYSEGATNRDSIAKKMTPGQIAEAQRLAREWKPKIDR